MAITIIAIPGASNSNSFCNELEFIAYAATRLNVPAGTTVSGSTCSETEKAALIEAQRRIAALETRSAEQEQAIRHTLTMLIEWIETEDYQRAAA